jgi:hypothetical protein
VRWTCRTADSRENTESKAALLTVDRSHLSQTEYGAGLGLPLGYLVEMSAPGV